MKSWLVCYDIEDNRERTRVAKLLEGYGQRVQYSVFELHLSGDADMVTLRQELQQVLGACPRIVTVARESHFESFFLVI